MAARVQTSYLAIRGAVNRNEVSFIYGLNDEIERYLKLFYESCRRPGKPIHHYHGSSMNIIDTLSDSGYQIVLRTNDGLMSTWILERLETSCGCTCHKLEIADDMEPTAGPSAME